MARRTTSPTPAPAPTPADVVDQSQAPWNDWFESQRDLFGAGLDQLAQTQQALLKNWLDLFDDMAKAWQAPLEGSWTFALPDALRLAPPLMQAWWAPWTPFLERGGEQLG